MKKKILVTGASGFLGGRLCHALIDQGYIVRAFVRKTSDLSSLPSPPPDGTLEFAYGDVTDVISLVEACFGCDAIFHSAAAVEPWIPDPSRFITVDVGGLKNVIEAFKEVKTVGRIIYRSSYFAIGPTDGYVADERQVHPEKFFCTEYERSKVIADKIALQAASEGLPIIPVYPGVIYGPSKVTAGNIVLRMTIHEENVSTVSIQLREAMCSHSATDKTIGMDWSKRRGVSVIASHVDEFRDVPSLDHCRFVVVHGAGSICRTPHAAPRMFSLFGDSFKVPKITKFGDLFHGKDAK